MEPFFLTVWLTTGRVAVACQPVVCTGSEAWGTLGLTSQDLSNSGLRCERGRFYQWLLIAWRRKQDEIITCFTVGKLSVACARSHSSLVVSQAGAPAVPPLKSGVGPGGSCRHMPDPATDVIRTGGRILSSLLFVGLVGCLQGPGGPLTCMLSQSCHPFLGLCPSTAPWGDTLAGFPLSPWG